MDSAETVKRNFTLTTKIFVNFHQKESFFDCFVEKVFKRKKFHPKIYNFCSESERSQIKFIVKTKNKNIFKYKLA